MKVAIIGAGGHGRVVLDILRNNHQFDVVGFLDNNIQMQGRNVDGIPIIGQPDNVGFMRYQFNSVIVAIGDNEIRNKIAQHLKCHHISLVNAIHPYATIAGNAKIGSNVTVAAGSHVCTHCDIGDSVILNTGSIIDHECKIGRASHICPGAKLAGRVNVGEGAFIGIGATVVQDITIGDGAIIGAGSVVLEDVEANTTVVGVPARVIKSAEMVRA